MSAYAFAAVSDDGTNPNAMTGHAQVVQRWLNTNMLKAESETKRISANPILEAWKFPLDRESFQILHWYIVVLLIIRYINILTVPSALHFALQNVVY